MLSSTVPKLQCLKRKKGKSHCGGKLLLKARSKQAIESMPSVCEAFSGHLQCEKCHSQFPILAGVAILVDDVRNYLLHHAKGIGQVVPDSEIPKEYLRDFKEAKAELQVEHIEEDLEAERV